MASPQPARAPGIRGWEPGFSVGRFTLLTPLAYGGMAEIWLARQSGLKGFEKLVVIKRMVDALAENQEYVDMFLTEARLAAQLTHPNVVQIYELGEEAGSLYIVMEYLDGEDLSVVRRTGQKHGLPLLDHFAVKLISMAAEGLHYAHTRTGLDGRALGIVHRDISPQNLIVTFDGGLKVVDFGIAKAAAQHTNSGKLKGKLAYMSPEQARGEQLDGRSDVFALGVVLFELITRTRLLPKMNDLELLTYMSSNDPLPLPTSRRADVPEGLEPIIMKALARKRENRFHNAREMHEALEAWLGQQGKRVSAGDIADYMRAVFARRIHERRQLIEAAISSDLTPTSAKHLTEMAARQRGPGTGSKSSSHSATGPGEGGTPKAAIFALVALSVLVLGIGIAVVKRLGADDPAPTPVPRTPPRNTIVVQPPPAAPSKLSVSTVPPGVSLVIDGKPRGKSPLSVEGLSVGDHQIEAAMEGYQPSTRTVTVASAGVQLVVELAMVPVPPPEVVKPPPDPTPVKPVVAQRPNPKKPPPPKEEPLGKLTLKTTPWSTVYLGKKKLGDTPLLNVPLPAGKHVLRLVNPDTKSETSIEVEVEANETTVKKLVL